MIIYTLYFKIQSVEIIHKQRAHTIRYQVKRRDGLAQPHFLLIQSDIICFKKNGRMLLVTH